jgi:hypothetical protein
MSDVLLGGADRKHLPRSLPLIIEPRRREARPPPCRSCCGAAWWNGWRVTYPVVASTTDSVTRLELTVPRAKCSCCHLGFTCYPAGFYPRRQYQLDVVADVTAAVAVGGASVADAAAARSASPTSVRRWSAWIAALAEVTKLHAVAAQIDPSTATVATPTPSSRSAAVLDALEVLGAALVRAGVALVERTGLGRVLGWQHRAHDDVLGLVAGPRRFSPAMASGGRPDRR